MPQGGVSFCLQNLHSGGLQKECKFLTHGSRAVSRGNKNAYKELPKKKAEQIKEARN